MKGPGGHYTTTTVPGVAPDAAAGYNRLCLIIVDGENVTTHPLPGSGVFTIGRTAACNIRIDRPWISRQHARLHVGPVLRLEDLGSSNGTSLRGTPLQSGETVDLAPGDAIGLGPSTLWVQRLSAGSRRRRIWSHASFEGLLEGECARAERSHTTFAVLRIHASANSAATTEEVLSSALRPEDVAAAYAPGEYEMLLIDANAAQAEAVMQALRREFDARRMPVRIGMAIYPEQGRAPDSLISNASASIAWEEAGAADVPHVVRDPAMKQLYELLGRVAAGTINVLLLGETGVGKEVVAESLHRLSPRKDRPFLRLNCAALPESILESELFGHERGAFTGAVSAKEGLLATADHGTVLLDEVGELPPSIQVKLLRVIEESQVRRVGGVKPQPIDIRFVSATNRNLELDVEEGRFRQDLFFRLNGVMLAIPPLCERPSEIEALAVAFVARVSHAMQRSPAPSLSAEALELLLRYSWPGNIRELRNVMERAVLLCRGDRITLDHLPVEKMDSVSHHASPSTKADDRQRLVEALEACSGNQTRAARLLGISRGTLVAWLDRYDLPRPRRRS